VLGGEGTKEEGGQGEERKKNWGKRGRRKAERKKIKIPSFFRRLAGKNKKKITINQRIFLQPVALRGGAQGESALEEGKQGQRGTGNRGKQVAGP